VAADADSATLAQAQERLREGNRLFDAGDYEGARVAYRQSAALVAHGATYRNLARAELKLNDPVAALKHLRMALSSPDMNADRKAITRQDLDAAYSATGHIAVTTSPGAGLTVDGNAIEGTAPFSGEIDVTVGKHTLEARLGSQSAKTEVDAKAGQVASIELSISPSAPMPPAPAVTGNAPPAPQASGASMPEVPPPEGPSSFWNTRREIGVGVAAAGVVALGVSAYFYADSNSQRDQASSLAAGLPVGACGGSSPPAACSQLQSARDAQSTDVTWRTVFLSTGVVAVLVGAGLFFWPTSNHSNTAIVPFFTHESGGLQLRGEL
jgi:hypothetical protein